MKTATAQTRCTDGRHRWRPARAFTLVEVMLAVVLLASMSVLIGSLLSQMREWAEDAGDAGSSLRVTRVIEALREQWGSRRTAVGITEGGSSVSVSPEALNFVTARPLLFTDWPLVIAEYRIEEDFESNKGQGRRWKLMYTERRVTAMKDQSSDERDLAGRRLVESITLVSSCELLEWQRPPRRATADETGDGAIGAEPGEKEPAGNTAAVTTSSLRAADEPELYRRIEWAVVTPQSKEPSMVRLGGKRNKEEFSCVLVVRASR